MDRLFHFSQKLLSIVFFCFVLNFTGKSQTTLQFISPSDKVCVGKTYEFSCTDIGADSYTWEIPSEFSIMVNGVKKTGLIEGLDRLVKIHIDQDFSGIAIIRVNGVTSGVAGIQIQASVFKNSSGNCMLERPEFVDQPKYICEGTAVKYSLKPVPDAEGYEWVLPADLKALENSFKTFTTAIPEINVVNESMLIGNARNVGQIKVKAVLGDPYNLSSIVTTTDQIFVTSPPVFTIEPQNITSCIADNGSLNIKDLVPDIEYSVRYEKDGVNIGPQVLPSDRGGVIVIPDLGEGTYSNFVVEAGCSSNINSQYIIGKVNPVLNGVGFKSPDYCNEKGKVILSLENAVLNEIFDIDYNEDNVKDFTGTVNNNGDIEIKNLPAGFEIDNTVKITSTVTGCVSTKTASGKIINPQSASIDTVIIINPQYCNSNGQVNIKLSNVLPDDLYNIDLNSDKIFDYKNVKLSENYFLDNMRPDTEVKGLLVENVRNRCRDSVLYEKSVKAPVLPSITGVKLINPTFCGGTGALAIRLATGVENDLYTIRFNDESQAYSSNITLSRDTLFVKNIPNGTIINTFEIVNNATLCNTFNTLNGIITDSPASFTISDVKLIQPVSCNDLGSLEISLTNIADGEKMGIDLNNDLIPEDSLIAQANKIILEDLPNGYSVKNILLTKFSTNCNAGTLFTGTINPPYLPDVNLPEFKPVCYSEEAFTLKGGSPSGGTYLVDNIAATSIVPSLLGIGSHKVVYQYSDANNCTNSDTANLIIEDLPKVIIEGDGFNMCPNMARATYTSRVYRSHNYLWEVEGGEITEGQTQPQVDVLWDKDQDLKKRLRLKITNSISGCFDTISRAISIVDTIAPFILECANSTTLKAKAELKGWEAALSETNGLKLPEVEDNCTDETKLTFSVNNTDFYEISELEGFKVDALKPASILWQAVDLYQNKSECITKIDFDYIEVIPSAFSPNNDATNNTWEINFLFQYPNSVVRVFNRWGMKVFESEKGYPVPWDGTCNGKKVPVDSYYYSITIGNENNKELNGSVTVIY